MTSSLPPQQVFGCTSPCTNKVLNYYQDSFNKDKIIPSHNTPHYGLRIFCIYCFAYKTNNVSTYGACSEAMFESIRIATNFSTLKDELGLTPLGMPSWVWPQWTKMECSLFKPPDCLQACIRNLLTGMVLYAKQPPPHQTSCSGTRWLYYGN